MNLWPLLPVGAFVGWQLTAAGLHRRRLRRIRLRIHVNGTRGKSQTVELITYGLRAAGLRVVGKVTGVVPALLLPDGGRAELHRLGPGSIAEQMGVVRRSTRLGVDALVAECNAIDPELQQVSQERMLQAQIGVITNVRCDHTDVLGASPAALARALGMTIPVCGTLITGEKAQRDTLERMATARHARLIEAPSAAVAELVAGGTVPGWIHRENLELALTVCEAVGADLTTAMEGALDAPRPPGAWFLRRIECRDGARYVLNAFSANDLMSTQQLMERARCRLPGSPPLVVAYNHRRDRVFRLENLAPLLAGEDVHRLILLGDRVPRWRRRFPRAVCLARGRSGQRLLDRLLDEAPPGALVVGVGNIAGPGLQLVSLLEGAGEPV